MQNIHPCIEADPSTRLSSRERLAARLLVASLLSTGLVTEERRMEVTRAGRLGRMWPRHCDMFKCLYNDKSINKA